MNARRSAHVRSRDTTVQGQGPEWCDEFWPLLSVGIPVYNGAAFLGRALESVLRSDYPNLEILISDNASTDETAEICSAYARADARIRYHRNERNVGAAANYCEVFRMARGKYFRWLAHDDWCEPHYDMVCVRKLESRPSAVLAFTAQNVIDESGKIARVTREHMPGTDSPAVHRRFRALVWRLRDPTAPVFGVMRTDALQRTGLIRNVPEPDRVLLYELGMYGTFHLVDCPLFNRYRPRGHLLHYGTGNSRRRSFDWLHPDNRSRLRLSLLRVLNAQIGGVWGSDASASNKLRCTWHILASAAALRPRGKVRHRRFHRKMAREVRAGQLRDSGAELPTVPRPSSTGRGGNDEVA